MGFYLVNVLIVSTWGSNVIGVKSQRRNAPDCMQTCQQSVDGRRRVSPIFVTCRWTRLTSAFDVYVQVDEFHQSTPRRQQPGRSRCALDEAAEPRRRDVLT